MIAAADPSKDIINPAMPTLDIDNDSFAECDIYAQSLWLVIIIRQLYRFFSRIE